MTPVYDNKKIEMGRYDGRFVYNSIGEKIYWVDGDEVFSMPPINREGEIGVRAAVKIADIVERVAIDSRGATVFTI